MLSCVKATQLIEQKSMDGLTMKDSLRLSMHVAVCSACRQYQKQSALLNDALSNHFNDSNSTFPKNGHHLRQEARKRIQEEIEKNLQKN